MITADKEASTAKEGAGKRPRGRAVNEDAICRSMVDPKRDGIVKVKKVVRAMKANKIRLL